MERCFRPQVEGRPRERDDAGAAEVQRMLALRGARAGAKRISRELGCSRNTVRSTCGKGWRPMDVASFRRAGVPPRVAGRAVAPASAATPTWCDGTWRELGIRSACAPCSAPWSRCGVSCAPRRWRPCATRRRQAATADRLRQHRRGHRVGGAAHPPVRRHPGLQPSRCYVAVFLHERQSAWLQGLEGTFRHFGGVPQEVLLDNARALVTEHNVQTREVKFNDRFHAFCRYWGVTPRACAPYRARPRKDERGWATSSATPSPAMLRQHGGAAGPPGALDARDCRHPGARHHRRAADHALRARGRRRSKPMPARRRSCRCASSPGACTPTPCIRLDTNRYSVPWEAHRRGRHRRRGRTPGAGAVRRPEVACPRRAPLRRTTVIDRRHLAGIVGAEFTVGRQLAARMPAAAGDPG